MWLLGPTLRRSAYDIGRTRVTRPPCGRGRQERTDGSDGGGWSKMSDEPLAREREPIERMGARLEALVMANAAPRCGARPRRSRVRAAILALRYLRMLGH